jgi:hypothetical protein
VWPRKAAAPIQPRRQPSLAQALAELGVDPKGGLVQIETLQAGRRNRQCRTPIRALTHPPRLAQRHPHLGTENAHVAFQIPQPNRAESQAVALVATRQQMGPVPGLIEAGSFRGGGLRSCRRQAQNRNGPNAVGLRCIRCEVTGVALNECEQSVMVRAVGRAGDKATAAVAAAVGE